jgi:hypothetical protein
MTASEIRYHYNRANALAEAEVIRRARKILRAHKNLDEIIMAMGVWHFTDKSDNILMPNDRKYFAPLRNFIVEWDPYFGLSGLSMRFTATGKIKRDW